MKWGLGLRVILSDLDMNKKAAAVTSSHLWQSILRTAQELSIQESSPTSVEHILRQGLFYNRRIVDVHGVPLGSKMLFNEFARKNIFTVGHIAKDNLEFETHEQLRVKEAALRQVHNAIPKDWLVILKEGFDPPSVGEFFLFTREMPNNELFKVKSIDEEKNLVVTDSYNIREDSVASSFSPTYVEFTLAPFELIRAQVVEHRQGGLVNGPLDEVELELDENIFINQYIHNEMVLTPLTHITVRDTTAALVQKELEIPSLHNTWPLMPVNRWRRVWMWVWASYRDKKVASFLWRAVHCRLYLGYDRRRYGDDVSCAICPETIESYEHFFHSCPSANDLWTWFRLVWQQTSGYQLRNDFMSKLFCSIPTRIFRSARNRWLVLSVAHGEILYSLWLQRCRAIYDVHDENDDNNNHIGDAHIQMSKQVLVAVAKHRIGRALQTIMNNKRWRCANLTQLCEKMRQKMHDIPP